MRSVPKLTALALSLVLATGPVGGPGRLGFSGTQVAPGIVVYGATPAELALARWAVARYGAARLSLPATEVVFHVGTDACHGRMGFFAAGRVDLCPGLTINLTTRHTILHELAHGWSARHVTGALRARFMELRGLGNWDSWDAPWALRGWEQAADILAWGIGDGVLVPPVPANDPRSLTSAFELLTGEAPPSA